MSLLSPQPHLLPHQHESARLSPPRSGSPFHNMSTRKRKADEDGEEMSLSPRSSPAVAARQLARPSKKARSTELIGRPLALPRLLETLEPTQLRTVLERICERHPEIGQEVVSSAPRPTVAAAHGVLQEYQDKLQAALPYGHGNSSADYTYFRVKAPLIALIDALLDFTPQYLPPTELQATISLQYLDGATKIIHGLPDWESPQHRHHKENAYDEISKAWALVINEAAKRGAGLSLHSGGWDQVLSRHHQLSGGRLRTAMQALESGVGWMGNDGSAAGGSNNNNNNSSNSNSILNQLLSGSYGPPVRVGPW